MFYNFYERLDLDRPEPTYPTMRGSYLPREPKVFADVGTKRIIWGLYGLRFVDFYGRDVEGYDARRVVDDCRYRLTCGCVASRGMYFILDSLTGETNCPQCWIDEDEPSD
jgi:hypothetical protein